jgi:hypothetical protein
VNCQGILSKDIVHSIDIDNFKISSNFNLVEMPDILQQIKYLVKIYINKLLRSNVASGFFKGMT